MKKLAILLFLIFIPSSISYQEKEITKIYNYISQTTQTKDLNYLESILSKKLNNNSSYYQKNIINTIKKEITKQKENLDKSTINIYAWWDVMISRFVWHKAKKDWRDYITKDYNPIDYFKNWIAIFNLESPFSKNPKDTNWQTMSFWANVSWIKALKNIVWDNIWVFSIANNHILNSQVAWYNLTKQILAENNFSYIWDAKEWVKIINTKILNQVQDDKLLTQDDKLLTQNDKGKNICFDWFSYDGNDINYKKVSTDNIKKSLDNMKNANCDIKIFSLHWWAEYKFAWNPKQKELAHFIIDNGWDIILWHHSHIPGEIETYKDKLIIYSLGNYIFDQNWWLTWCDKWKDCIFDEKLNKKTVPTYIWTLANISIIFQENNTYKITLEETLKHRIDYGKLEKY